jgi:aminomethyltransferase
VTESFNQPLKKTPLTALHEGLGGKLVPFSGYLMPLHFEGILAEHRHTRTAAGLFDVSHMGQAVLHGDHAAEAFESLTPGDVLSLRVGSMRYTLLTDAAGGILDDLMVTKHSDHLHLVVNAARKDADFAHIRERLMGKAELEVRSDWALLALQGPAAQDVLGRFSAAARHMMFMTTEVLTLVDTQCLVSRCGYTGEDGYEISVPAEAAERLARELLVEDEVKPIGLGARDSLRLEAGLCLYGHDIDTTTTPIEAALAWTVNRRRRAEGGFPGTEVIMRQLSEGPARCRVGLRPEGRIPVREGTAIVSVAGDVIGRVTSGGFSPTLGSAIAMGYIDAAYRDPGTPVTFNIRGKKVTGAVVTLPFVPHRYAKL